MSRYTPPSPAKVTDLMLENQALRNELREVYLKLAAAYRECAELAREIERRGGRA